MRFDSTITKAVGQWLNKKQKEESFEEGATLLLRMTGNRIQYAQFMRNPAKYLEMLEYLLQKHYNFRVADLTEEQLAGMTEEASAKMAAIGITESEASIADPVLPMGSDNTTIRFGKRPDHDFLPKDIADLYSLTLELRHQMQQLHLQIRTMLKTKTPCTASDIYAFVTELLKVEKKYLQAWEKYDNAPAVTSAATSGK